MEVVVTGLGIVSPLGNTIPVVWNNILSKKCATKHWKDLEQEGFRTARACRLSTTEFPEQEDRGKIMAIKAVEQAIEQSSLPKNQNIGVFVGTTMGESYAFEQAAALKPFDWANAAGSSFAKAIQSKFNLIGPTATFGTACAAGNYAISAAANAIKKGRVDAAIAGGVDPFSRIAMVGFSRSRAMASDFCRPFDEKRNGMMLGEAAAFLVLESLDKVIARGALPLAKIGALGLSCDAYHSTKPMPDASEIVNAMQNALRISGISKEDIDWICAHGSGTNASDATEALAISTLFGTNALPVSGFKGAFGHSLGAATAVEAIMCVQSIIHQTIPATINHNRCSQNMNIQVPTEHISQVSKWILNCGNAFGGLNSALLIGRV